MYKNFIQNIGLKEHITAVHEEKDSIVMNEAKILLEDATQPTDLLETRKKKGYSMN